MSDELEKYQNKHTADTKSIGFDYQFYYFMYLVLHLKPGEKVGFEMKDDIHIEKDNGEIELFQAKHSTQTKASGEIENLTELDSELWKTLSYWAECVNKSANKENFVNSHSFRLVTNKTNGINELISKVESYKHGNETTENMYSYLNDLSDKTKDQEIKNSIKSILSLAKKYFKKFLIRITIITDQTRIIQRIKNCIWEKIILKERVDSVFDTLYSNLQTNKYLDISERKKFVISFEDFSSKYARCFEEGFDKRILQVRDFRPSLPKDLENQIFIRQLLDIGDITLEERDIIILFTTYMLNAFNNMKYWEENYDILNSERKQFEDNVILGWLNVFRKHYRSVNRKINDKVLSKEEIEDEIKEAALKCVDEIRSEKLSLLDNNFKEEFSNGYYYLLSDELKIGWHLKWEEKYKKK